MVVWRWRWFPAWPAPIGAAKVMDRRDIQPGSAGPVSNFVRETSYRHRMTNLSSKITANCVFASISRRASGTETDQ